nr:hypothetical protein [Nitrososphaera sp. AFS]
MTPPMVLNMTDLPSMTGNAASGPKLPGYYGSIATGVLQFDVESIPTLLLHATTVV